jgi:hypothetical protein
MEKCVHKTTRVVAAAISSTIFVPIKSEMRSSWSDYIIDDDCLNNLNHEYDVVADNRNNEMLNKKAHVVAAYPKCFLNHYELKSATLFVENMKLTNAKFFIPQSIVWVHLLVSLLQLFLLQMITRSYCRLQP